MVKKGYKQTEVGVIPEDWSVSTLEKLYNITSSKRVFQSQWRKSGVPFYRAREIAVMSEGKIAPEDLYIDESLYNQYIHQYGSINKNDILITGVGTLGKVYVVKENDRFYFKDGNIIWLQAKHDFSSIYLKYQYDMPALINQVFGNAGGSTVATYTITNAKTTKVPVPPLPEQQRIAEALSDVDGMISSLEKLIAKYKSIKIACLQQMFPQNGETVPRMRLPGFTGAWEQRKLMSLCEKFTDGDWIEAKDQSDFGVRLIQTGNVGLGEYIDKPTNKKWIAEETFERLNCEEVFAGDILISRLPEPAGRACIMPNLGVKMITAVDCTIVRTATHINPKCLLQYLSSQSYFDKVNTCLAGGTRQRISRSNLAAFDVPVPAKYEEQKAIGEFLCGIDHLITLHQRKLEKVQKIKQGMMQQLLTGKIRLV